MRTARAFSVGWASAHRPQPEARPAARAAAGFTGGWASAHRPPVLPRLGALLLIAACSAPPAAAQLQILPQRVPAPSLSGAGQWLNVAGPLDLPDLRGKFVILDFWTYCCINCMHVLPELKKLEQAYPGQLVVIGVHSAKFATERDLENIRQAVLRYEIQHPVLNDADLVVWRKYAVDAWPSLRIIDPDGNVFAQHRGEFTFEELDRLLARSIPPFRRAGRLDERPLRFDLELYRRPETPLRFPGKVLADPEQNRLFIADSGNNRIVVAGLDGQLLATIGTGQGGHRDGDFTEAAFDHPQGMALHRDSLYVADTENHLIRRVDLAHQRVTTVAGNGRQARVIPRRARTSARIQPLASPWDLWVHGDHLYIAMAGTHQIWRMSLIDRVIGPIAGNGIEDIVDGRPLPPAPMQMGYASFAQPSGLASDGKQLFVADAEGSSIRAVPFGGGPVSTLLGTAGLAQGRLFTFGDRDGPAAAAMLQHPVGVAFDPRTASLYIADTYNDKIKRLELNPPMTVTTLPTGELTLDEPCGVAVAGDVLFVADTNQHRIVQLDLPGGTGAAEFVIRGLTPPQPSAPNPFGPVPAAVTLPLPTAAVRPSGDGLVVQFDLQLPPDHKIAPGAPMSCAVQSPAADVLDPAFAGRPLPIDPPAAQAEIRVPLKASSGTVPLKIQLVFYYCQSGAEGLCRIANVAWAGDLQLDAQSAEDRLQLSYTVSE